MSDKAFLRWNYVWGVFGVFAATLEFMYGASGKMEIFLLSLVPVALLSRRMKRVKGILAAILIPLAVLAFCVAMMFALWQTPFWYAGAITLGLYGGVIADNIILIKRARSDS